MQGVYIQPKPQKMYIDFIDKSFNVKMIYLLVFKFSFQESICHLYLEWNQPYFLACLQSCLTVSSSVLEHSP